MMKAIPLSRVCLFSVIISLFECYLFKWEKSPLSRNTLFNHQKRYPLMRTCPASSPIIQWASQLGIFAQHYYLEEAMLEMKLKYHWPSIEELVGGVVYKRVVHEEALFESILFACGRNIQKSSVVDYLKLGGFNVSEYSLAELISFFPLNERQTAFNILEYGHLNVDPLLQDFLESNAEIRPLLITADQTNSLKMAIEEGCPSKMALKLLRAGITDVHLFCRLEIFNNEAIGDRLIALITRYPKFGSMPNTFKEFSMYPDTIKLVYGVSLDTLRELVVFPACSAWPIDLVSQVGGWREEYYRGCGNLTARLFDSYPGLIEAAALEYKGFKEKWLSDVLFGYHDEEYYSAFFVRVISEENLIEIMGKIVGEERQHIVYRSLIKSLHLDLNFDNYDDSVIPELEGLMLKAYTQRITLNRSFQMEDSSWLFLKVAMIPILSKPDWSISKTIYAAKKAQIWYDLEYLDIVLNSVVASGDLKLIKDTAISAFETAFNIKLQPSLLEGISVGTGNFKNFKELAILLFNRVREIISQIDFFKIVRLLKEKSLLTHRLIICQEFASRICQVHCTSPLQIYFVNHVLLQSIGHSNSSSLFERLSEDIQDSRNFLNFLYSLIRIPDSFKHMIHNYGLSKENNINDEWDSNVSDLALEDSFGNDLLADIDAFIKRSSVI